MLNFIHNHPFLTWVIPSYIIAIIVMKIAIIIDKEELSHIEYIPLIGLLFILAPAVVPIAICFATICAIGCLLIKGSNINLLKLYKDIRARFKPKNLSNELEHLS